MFWTTYYIQSNGQPANNIVEHDDPAAAIDAWVDNIGALYARRGGKSVLIERDEPASFEYDEAGRPVQIMDEERGQELVWVEHIEGPYAHGELANRAGLEIRYEDLSRRPEVY